MRRLSPVQQIRMGGQKIIDKDIEFGQLIDLLNSGVAPRQE
jgi:hypothetical protein